MIFSVDLKPKIKKDFQIKTAILTILLTGISLFAWIALKRALYAESVRFSIESSTLFWKWFWIRAGWPAIGLGFFCAFLMFYLIAIRSRMTAFIAGILISASFIFTFLSAVKNEMVVYSGACIIFLGAIIIADGAIQKEERQRVVFDARPLVKRGLSSIIPALILMLSAGYYFSPLSKGTQSIAIPDKILDSIIKMTGDISNAPAEKTFDAQTFIKNYLKNNMPEAEGIISDSDIKDALKAVSKSGNPALAGASPSSLIKDIKIQINRQIEIIFSKYGQYLPAVFTGSFLFMLKFLSAEFSWVVVLMATLLVKICFAIGLFEKEIEMVEKESIVF